MTNQIIKQKLKDAYHFPESEKEKSFIKNYEKRSCQLPCIIKNEFRYMGIKSTIAGIFMCFLLWAVARIGDEKIMWTVSSFIPICSVVPLSLIFHSEQFGMCELEAASRFSLRFIRLIRMLILGIFSGIVTLFGSILLRRLWTSGILDIVMYMLFPYLVSIWGSLLTTRKWHGKESGYGVMAICFATGLLPTIIRELKDVFFMSDYVYVIFLAVLLTAIIKECISYINERSDILWNLC